MSTKVLCSTREQIVHNVNFYQTIPLEKNLAFLVFLYCGLQEPTTKVLDVQAKWEHLKKDPLIFQVALMSDLFRFAVTEERINTLFPKQCRITFRDEEDGVVDQVRTFNIGSPLDLPRLPLESLSTIEADYGLALFLSTKFCSLICIKVAQNDELAFDGVVASSYDQEIEHRVAIPPNPIF